MVSASVQSSTGFELEQKTDCMSLCLSATSILSSFLKICFLSLITVLYMLSLDGAFCESLYL